MSTTDRPGRPPSPPRQQKGSPLPGPEWHEVDPDPSDPGPTGATGSAGSAGTAGASPPRRRWVQRAPGDRRARARLRMIEGEGVIVLNDRRIPGSRENIKRIAVSAAGVFVIDAKHYKGLVHVRRSGPISDLGPDELHVGRRNCTPCVEEVARQVDQVRNSLGSTTWGNEVPVHAMLCLTRAEWGFASAIRISDVWVAWPQLIAGQVRQPGMMDSPTVQEVSVMIAERLPVG